MENNTRVMVSAEEVTTNSDADHSFKKPGRMYVTFNRCFKLDDPTATSVPCRKRRFSFPLAAFASAATARAFLDPALTALFIRFPYRRTLWQDPDVAAPCPIDGLAGASQKIAELGASIAALSTGTSPEMLVKIQKLVTVDGEGSGYYDGETEEGSRMWVSAEQINGEADNAQRQGVEVAIKLSHRLEGPICGLVTTVGTHQFSFPLAAFASATTALAVLAPAIAGLRIRSPTLGTFWCGADNTLVPDQEEPYPSPNLPSFWRNGDEEWSHPLAGLAAASEKIAELGVTMGVPGKIRVEIQKITVMQRPENAPRYTKAKWEDYISAVKTMENTLFFEDKIEMYNGGGNEGSEKLTCPICINDVEIGCHVIYLPCTHVFHADCIKMWEKKSRSCPYCRSPF